MQIVEKFNNDDLLKNIFLLYTHYCQKAKYMSLYKSFSVPFKIPLALKKTGHKNFIEILEIIYFSSRQNSNKWWRTPLKWSNSNQIIVSQKRSSSDELSRVALMH